MTLPGAPEPDQTRIELHARVDHNLTLHSPTDPAVGVAMDAIRQLAKLFGHLIVDVVPGGRDKSLALTALEDTVARAIGGIARDQEAVLEWAATADMDAIAARYRIIT